MTVTRLWTEGELRRLRVLAAGGLSDAAIARRLGRSETAVADARRNKARIFVRPHAQQDATARLRAKAEEEAARAAERERARAERARLQAEEAARRAERERARAEKKQWEAVHAQRTARVARRCLACGTAFTAQGRWQRLCARCRPRVSALAWAEATVWP